MKLCTDYEVLDLFCGAGGLSLGFKHAGFRIALAVDKWEPAVDTYKYNHPDARVLYCDIKEVDSSSLKNVADNKSMIIIGGPPCQGFSLANTKSRNPCNENNQLSWKFIELVSEVKPKIFVMENVYGIFSLKINGKDVAAEIDRILKSAGYDLKVLKLSAENFGVPQVRRRVFFIGLYKKSLNISEKNVPCSRLYYTVRDAISDLARVKALPDTEKDMHASYHVTLRGNPKSEYQKKMRDSEKVFNHVYHKPYRIAIERMKYIREGENLYRARSRIPKDLLVPSAQNGKIHMNIYRRLAWNKPSPTIVHVRKAMLIHPSYNRLLTAREAARLQGFPDSYRFFGTLNQQYQMIADAVPPPMASAIANLVKNIINRLK